MSFRACSARTERRNVGMAMIPKRSHMTVSMLCAFILAPALAVLLCKRLYTVRLHPRSHLVLRLLILVIHSSRHQQSIHICTIGPGSRSQTSTSSLCLSPPPTYREGFSFRFDFAAKILSDKTSIRFNSLLAGVFPRLNESNSPLAGISPRLNESNSRLAGVFPRLNESNSPLAGISPRD